MIPAFIAIRASHSSLLLCAFTALGGPDTGGSPHATLKRSAPKTGPALQPNTPLPARGWLLRGLSTLSTRRPLHQATAASARRAGCCRHYRAGGPPATVAGALPLLLPAVHRGSFGRSGGCQHSSPGLGGEEWGRGGGEGKRTEAGWEAMLWAITGRQVRRPSSACLDTRPPAY